MCDKLPYCARRIDPCLITVIHAINTDQRYRTMLSCCGHGQYSPTIIVYDRVEKRVFEWYSHAILLRYFKNGHIRTHFYKKDNKGYFYLPDVSRKINV